MNKKLLAAISFLAAALIFLPTLSSSAYGQKPDRSKMKKANLESTKAVSGTAGAKGFEASAGESEAVNDEAGSRAVPAGKSGAKGAALCGVLFDNYTNLVIKAYVDGNFEGTIARMGELAAYPIAGGTVVRARADFTDGDVKTWGPVTFECKAGSVYTWKLTN